MKFNFAIFLSLKTNSKRKIMFKESKYTLEEIKALSDAFYKWSKRVDDKLYYLRGS